MVPGAKALRIELTEEMVAEVAVQLGAGADVERVRLVITLLIVNAMAFASQPMVFPLFRQWAVDTSGEIGGIFETMPRGVLTDVLSLIGNGLNEDASGAPAPGE